VKANQAEHPIQAMCKHLNVSTSGFYDWLGRAPSARATANAQLTQRIAAIHSMSDATYGMPRMRAELADTGTFVSRKRIARLMRQAHLQGVSRRRSWCVTTERHQRERPAPDLVERNFTATGINQLWVADMTYIPTWEGFLYLAEVTDVYSRKVVGWAFGVQITADLVISALNMAVQTRRPESVIHHSDQGSQYTSIAFGKRCKEMGVRPSMGSVGDAYDNAMAESFFASLECELIARRTWKTKAEARMAVSTWIESWYTPRHRHSDIGQKSPNNFEKELQHQKEKPTQRPLPEHGLPTACFAPVDKPPHVPVTGTSACQQASTVDNPAPSIINDHMMPTSP
jgi:putative transposase